MRAAPDPAVDPGSRDGDAPRAPFRVLKLVLLVVAAAAYTHSILSIGVVVDESPHLNAGLVYWQTGRTDADPQHPPLRALFALPAAILGDRTPEGKVFHRLESPSEIADLRAGRFTALGLFLLWAGWISRRVGRWVGDRRVGVSVLAVILFEPTFAAHGHLVATDALFAMAGSLLVVALRGWVLHPSWRGVPGLGAAFGATMLAKHSAALWVGPALAGAVATFVALRFRRAGVDASLRRGVLGGALVRLAAGVVLGLFVVAAAYRFEGVARPIGQTELVSEPMRRLADMAGSLPSPLPSGYLRGVDFTLDTADRNAYFHLEHRAHGGFRQYFPVLLLLKPPLSWLALVGMGLLAVAMRRDVRRSAAVLVFAVPSFVFFSYTVLFSTIQIGIRHLAPVLVPLLLVAGWAPFARPGRLWRGTGLAMVAATVVGGLAVTPHHLASFNLLAGGPEGAWRWFNDSNQDWWQGDPFLERWSEERGIEPKTWATRGRTTGWIALSTNTLTGFSQEKFDEIRWIWETFERREFVPPYFHLFYIPEDHWQEERERRRRERRLRRRGEGEGPQNR